MSEVKKCGWLIKQGGKWKSWKQRWFVYENATLNYYKDQLMMKQKGSINLHLATTIQSVRKYKKYNNVFKIVTPSRTYYINCPSEDQMNEWIKILRNLNEEVNKTVIEIRKKELSQNDFEILSLIGRGSFGKVFLVKNKNNEKLYAMKVVSKKSIIEEEEVEHSMTERNILCKIHHPFLVNLYCSYQTPSNLHYIIDYCPGGELYAIMQRDGLMSESRAKFYAAQLILALEHLHNQGILYRDIKPENILICADGYVRLTDFGLSKMNVSRDSKTATFCGTPEYLAPEVIQNVAYTNAIDWWGIGILIFEMLFGHVPFFDENIQQLYHNIVFNQLVFPDTNIISIHCKDIITQLLKKNPIERLHDVELIKNHIWFASIDWDELYQKKLPVEYVPELESLTDLRHFNEEIIAERASVGVAEEVESDLFNDFDYTADNIE